MFGRRENPRHRLYLESRFRILAFARLRQIKVGCFRESCSERLSSFRKNLDLMFWRLCRWPHAFSRKRSLRSDLQNVPMEFEFAQKVTR